MRLNGAFAQEAARQNRVGAEETVRWDHTWDAVARVHELRVLGYEIAAIETSVRSVDLFEWTPRGFRCACCSGTKSTASASRCARWPIRKEALVECGHGGRGGDLRAAAQTLSSRAEALLDVCKV